VSIEDDIAVLEQVPMLRALGRSALRMIALGAESRELEPGDMLFRPGEKVDSAYVVQDGEFQLSADPAKSGRPITAGPGAMLGEFSLMAESAKPLCAVAQGPCTVIRIPRNMFLKILEDDGFAATRLRDYVAQRAQRSLAEIDRIRQALDKEEN